VEVRQEWADTLMKQIRAPEEIPGNLRLTGSKVIPQTRGERKPYSVSEGESIRYLKKESSYNLTSNISLRKLQVH
jgi:hypothetical protein